MQPKFLEIRDRATCILVMAAKMQSNDPIEAWYLSSSGYGSPGNICPLVVVTTLHPLKSEYSPYDWGTFPRTMFIAHSYIAANFDELKSGDVVDVEYVQNEKPKPKTSERYLTGRHEHIEEGADV